MFVGQYLHTLDDKNRLVLPSKFRDSFSATETDKGVYITLATKDIGSFLTIHPADAWKREVERWERAAQQDEQAEWFLRKSCWTAEYCRMDPQWRIMVPPRLTETAQLKRDVMVVGVFRAIEVWDVEVWKSVDKNLSQQAPQLQKSIYRLGGSPEGSRG